MTMDTNYHTVSVHWDVGKSLSRQFWLRISEEVIVNMSTQAAVI